MIYEEVILNGVVANRPEEFKERVANLNYLLSAVPDKFFTDEFGSLYKAVKGYFLMSGGLTTLDVLDDILTESGATPEKQVEYQVLFRRIATLPYDQNKFRYAVSHFLKEKEKEVFVAACTKAVMAINDGWRDEENKKTYKGYADARFVLSSDMNFLDGLSELGHPEGDIREETEEVLKDYEEMKLHFDKHRGCLTGIDVVDGLTNGGQPGELWIVGGFTGSGKSFALANAAYNAAIHQGKNVVIGSAEMRKKEYRRRLIARHTMNEKFGLTSGIRLNEIKYGKLDAANEESLRTVLTDLKENKDYGKIQVFQLPYGAGLDYCRAKLNQYQSVFPVDAFYLDYLSLLAPTRKRNSSREELDELIIGFKRMALDFNGGKGLFTATAHQVNRQSWEKAKKCGFYELDAFANSSEAEKSADLCWWLLKQESVENQHEIKSGIAKYRDGETIKDFLLYDDFSVGFLGNLKASLDTGEVTL